MLMTSLTRDADALGSIKVEVDGNSSYHFYTFGMVRPWDSKPRPPAPKAEALPTKLSRG